MLWKAVDKFHKVLITTKSKLGFMTFRPEKSIEIELYNYDLPPEKIANYPTAVRSDSKLLVYKESEITEDQFDQLPVYLDTGYTLVLNNSRVIAARVIFQKESGGSIEIFCLEPENISIDQGLSIKDSVVWRCLIGGVSKWKVGQVLYKDCLINKEQVTLTATFKGKQPDHFLIQFSWSSMDFSFSEILEEFGAIPLPPYIKRQVTTYDWERYQTIFSQHQGSVAAPTAALHFTDEIFNALRQKKIDVTFLTLHVGAGTFQPIKTKTANEHLMHSERFSISKQSIHNILDAKKIIAVGTTSLRSLESLYWLGVKHIMNVQSNFSLGQWEAYQLASTYSDISTSQSLKALLQWMDTNNVNDLQCKTSLMIVPGYQFRMTSGLITNFHQPQSTLLLLVSAFIGKDWKKVYRYALEHDFRFLSYGDSSLLWRNEGFDYQ